MDTHDAQRRTPLALLLGGPVVLRADRVLAGGVPGGLDGLPSRLTELTHRRGKSCREGGGLVWEHAGEVDSLRLRATCGPQEAHLQAQSGHSAMAGFVYFVVFFVGLFIAAALAGFVVGVGSLAEGVALGAVGLLCCYLVARIVWRTYARRRQQALESLLDALSQPASQA